MKPLSEYHAKATPLVPWASVEEGLYEMAVIQAIGERLGIGSGDAIDVMEPWRHLVKDARKAGVSAVEAARMLDECSSRERA